MTGAHVDLPDTSSIMPYLGLFTIVILKPSDVAGCLIQTSHLPALSILRNNHFELAPTGTSPADPDTARIFDSLAMAGTTPPMSLGYIPLSPTYPEFHQRRYWRLPLQIEAVFAALMDRVGTLAYECEEIHLVQKIFYTLRLRRLGVSTGRVTTGRPSYDVGPGPGGGPADDNSPGDGPSGPSGNGDSDSKKRSQR